MAEPASGQSVQRYYDPQIGRFLSVDPVTAYSNGDSRYFNRYWYAAGNPYKFTDPDGRGLDTAVDAGFVVYDTGRFLGAVAAWAHGKLSGDQHLAAVGLQGMKDTGRDVGASTTAMAIPGLVAPVTRAAVHGAEEAISMTQAVERGVAHVGPDAKAAMTPAGNVQFSSSAVDAAGNTVTKNARFDVNPNSGHVQKQGPHLNLETQIKSPSGAVTKLPDPHTPIKPETIRRGDYD